MEVGKRPFHKPKRKSNHKVVSLVNNILFSNRRILNQLLVETDKLRITKRELHLRGFNFLYFTHTSIGILNRRYFFCYEYAYFPFGQEWYLIMRPPTGP
jgi:hypothetical protein